MGDRQRQTKNFVLSRLIMKASLYSLQIDNEIPSLSIIHRVVEGKTKTLKVRPTVPVLCNDDLHLCNSLHLYLSVPTPYERKSCEAKNKEPPFSEQRCGVYIKGHARGEDWNDYLRKSYKLRIYGKVTYQIGDITPRTFIAMLRFPPKATFPDHPVWENFTVSAAVSRSNLSSMLLLTNRL